MTKRLWFALIYLGFGTAYGGGIAFALHRAEAAMGDPAILTLLYSVGILGLALLSFPAGAIPLVTMIVLLAGVSDVRQLFIMTPATIVIGYGQWFFCFPWLFRRLSRRRELRERNGGMTRFSRFVPGALHVVAILLVGWITILISQFFTSVFMWPGTAVAMAFFVIYVLTFPCGILGIAIVVPLIVMGYCTQNEALFIAAPFMAAFGWLQWFRLLPRAYRQKQTVTDVF